MPDVVVPLAAYLFARPPRFPGGTQAPRVVPLEYSISTKDNGSQSRQVRCVRGCLFSWGLGICPHVLLLGSGYALARRRLGAYRDPRCSAPPTACCRRERNSATDRHKLPNRRLFAYCQRCAFF